MKVALVKELCPVCGSEINGPIIMNRILTEEVDNEIEQMNGKVIGFADHCCEQCAKYKNEVIFFVGIDETKSSNGSLQELYRTGQISRIKKDSEIVDAYKDYIITLKDETKIIFIDEKAGINLGIFKDTNEED